MKSLEAAENKKTMRSKETKKSEYLPEEVIAEILCRLPVKSILQGSCVCKLWYSLIRNPNFITAHLQKTTLSSSNPNTNHYFLCHLSGRYSLRLDNQDFVEYMNFEGSLGFFNSYRFHGSCNGVICLSSGDKVVLCNPSIRKSISLPDFSIRVASNHTNFFAVGYASRSHDYKVLRFVALNYKLREINILRAELYSLNSNSWKDITQIAPKQCVWNFNTKYVGNGSLYWIAQINNNGHRHIIIVFDLNDEIFHGISLPGSLAKVNTYNLSVYQLGEFEIAVVYKNDNYYSYHIWVLKEYGAAKLWEKLAYIPGGGELKISSMMGFRSNGELLIKFSRSLVSRKLNSQRVKKLMALRQCEPSYFWSYVESLVLLDKENDGDTSDASGSTAQNMQLMRF